LLRVRRSTILPPVSSADDEGDRLATGARLPKRRGLPLPARVAFVALVLVALAYVVWRQAH